MSLSYTLKFRDAETPILTVDHCFDDDLDGWAPPHVYPAFSMWKSGTASASPAKIAEALLALAEVSDTDQRT